MRIGFGWVEHWPRPDPEQSYLRFYSRLPAGESVKADRLEFEHVCGKVYEVLPDGRKFRWQRKGK